MVANAFLLFCVSQGYRKKEFSPFLAKITNAYLDRDELLVRGKNNTAVPEIEELVEFVLGQTTLRNRVAAGLMLFGGLRVGDMLAMRLSDVPMRLDVERIGTYRVAFKVFGKGRKWRTTTIPEWVYNDLRKLASSERSALRKALLRRNLKVPMGRSAPVFVGIKEGPNFGKPLTSKFVRNIFQGSAVGNPHRARHAFACWRMIELLGMRSVLLQQHPMTALAEAGLHGDVKDMLALEMGHVSVETTEIYLKWARRQIIDRETLSELLYRIQKAHNGR
jgi:integrase